MAEHVLNAYVNNKVFANPHHATHSRSASLLIGAHSRSASQLLITPSRSASQLLITPSRSASPLLTHSRSASSLVPLPFISNASSLPLNEHYRLICKDVEDKAESKKSSEKKLKGPLKNLFYFRITEPLLPSLLAVLSRFDNKLNTIRNVHFLLAELSRFECARDASLILETLRKEFTSKDPNRRLLALRSHALLHPFANSHVGVRKGSKAQQLFPEIAPFSELILNDWAKGRGDLLKLSDKKKRGSRAEILHNISTTESCLALRCLNPNTLFEGKKSLIQDIIIEGLHAKDSAAARHATALAILWANQNPEIACNVLRNHIPGKKDYQQNDPLWRDTYSSVHFVRLCLKLAFLDLSGSEDFYWYLSQRVSISKNWRVAFEAAAGLADNWGLLSTSKLSSCVEGTNIDSVLGAILERLSRALQDAHIPLQHAGARLARTLAIKWLKSPCYTTQKLSPLVSLKRPLFSLCRNEFYSIPVRSMALRALVWLAETSDDLEELSDILLRSLSLPTFIHKVVWRELESRVQVSSELAEALVKLIRGALQPVPDSSLPMTPICNLCKTVISLGPSSSTAILKVIFDTLDTPFTPETRIDFLRIQSTLCWLLGDMFIQLCGIVESKAKAHDILQNSAASSIIFRLEHLAIFASWNTRAICLEALSKIAQNIPYKRDRTRFGFFQQVVVLPPFYPAKQGDFELEDPIETSRCYTASFPVWGGE